MISLDIGCHFGNKTCAECVRFGSKISWPMDATIVFYTVRCHGDDGISQSLFLSRADMLSALCDGVFRNPLAVYESEVAGLCRDISEDAARELSDMLARDQAGLPVSIADFIERELGVGEGRRLRHPGS